MSSKHCSTRCVIPAAYVRRPLDLNTTRVESRRWSLDVLDYWTHFTTVTFVMLLIKISILKRTTQQCLYVPDSHPAQNEQLTRPLFRNSSCCHSLMVFNSSSSSSLVLVWVWGEKDTLSCQTLCLSVGLYLQLGAFKSSTKSELNPMYLAIVKFSPQLHVSEQNHKQWWHSFQNPWWTPNQYWQ